MYAIIIQSEYVRHFIELTDKRTIPFEESPFLEITPTHKETTTFNISKANGSSVTRKYSFEMNHHSKTLLAQIQGAKKSADAMRLYPGAFSETLVQLMKERKLSNKKLADSSLVGEKTIQRLRNNEEYPTTVQTVMGLCYGLKLSVPEAEMLIGKTDFNIKPTTPQNNAYRCALSACAETSIYEINEMLESCGYEPLGSSSLD